MADAVQPALPSFDVMFQRALLIYRARWRTVASIIAIGAAATLAAAVVVPLLLFLVLLRQAPGRSWEAFIFSTACAVFLASAVFLWAQVALGLCLVDPERGPGAKECFDAAWARMAGFAWVCLLVGAACAGGLFLLVVPGLVLSVYLCFAPFIYLSEGIGGFDALLKSCHYIRGRFWPVTGRLTAFWVPAAATAFVPFAKGPARLVVMPFVLIGSALLLAELRRLRGQTPFAPSRRAKLLLALAVSGLAVPVYLLPRALGWASPRVLAMESRLARKALDSLAPRRPGRRGP
ncbi:MAG: hypothetical protein NTY77_09375 [Elusimicrobia bacterium]|nr:hypothetical protein [Elusimicrobiota bacterium]